MRTSPTSRDEVLVVLTPTDLASLGRWADTLRGELRPGDEVVIRTDDRAGAERAARPLRNVRITDRHAPILADAAERQRGRSVVLIDRDGTPARRGWLADLVALAAGPGIGAAGPRTNGAPFPACLRDGPDTQARKVDLRAAFQPPAAPADPIPVDTLGGPVVVLSAAGAATLTGSEGTTAEVTSTIASGGLQLVRSPSSYIHTTEGVPFVSACLIVKDEQADLADCLASLAPLVDEVIVYDTGSTDDSVAVARAAGAVVIRGEWRDDFAWARNEALAAARGTWVLSIDADERLELDRGVAPELRGLLGDDPPVDRFIVPLFDLQGSVHAPVRSSAGVPMARLFRRRRVTWVGRLHEQPDARPGQAPLRNVQLPGVCFLHHGYLDEIIAAKGKWERNLKAVVTDLDELPTTDKACFDLGRSLRSVGQTSRAFTMFERAADLGQNVVITRAALEFAVMSLNENGQAADAGPLLDRLRRLEGGAGPARYLQGWTHVNLREWTEALACLDGVTDYHDHFTGFRQESLDLALAMSYRGVGNRPAAADAAATALRKNPRATEAWALLLDCCDAGSHAERQAVTGVTPDVMAPLFAALARFPASARHRVAEALWQARPGDRTLLAVGSQLATEVEEDAVVCWALRLRLHGLASLCPTRAVADDGNRTVLERARILARVLHEHDDDGVSTALERLVALLHDPELGDLLERALTGFPGAATAVLVAGSTTPARCVIVMRALVDHGHPTEAAAVLAHALELDGDAVVASLRQDRQLYGALAPTARRERPELAAILDQAA